MGSVAVDNDRADSGRMGNGPKANGRKGNGRKGNGREGNGRKDVASLAGLISQAAPAGSLDNGHGKS